MTEPTQPLPANEPESFDDPAADPVGTAAARPTWRAGLHPLNTGHLVMGVALVGLTVIWALIASGAASFDDLRWLLPIPWVAAGVAGLVASAPRLRSTRD